MTHQRPDGGAFAGRRVGQLVLAYAGDQTLHLLRGGAEIEGVSQGSSRGVATGRCPCCRLRDAREVIGRGILAIVLRRVLVGLGLVLALYLVVRAVVEPFVIDVTDASTYRDDWGGPSLLGVLAVHCGPGVVAGAIVVLWWRRRPHSTER